MADSKVAHSGLARAPSKGPLILVLVNVVAVAAGLGVLAYTKLIYQKPRITEESERAKLDALRASPAPDSVPGYLTFEPTTVNIAATPNQPKAADGTSTQLQGKLHYAQIGFSLEIRDVSHKDDLEAIRPLVMDRFLVIVGKKEFQELITVDGRYHLKDQLLDAANELIAKRLPDEHDPLVTHVYFTQFVVQ